MAASVSSALRVQLNCEARSRPAGISRSRRPSSVAAIASASARPAPSSGSTSSAAPPQVSGSAARLAATTGTPLAMASSTGRPKPSYSDGMARASAPA